MGVEKNFIPEVKGGKGNLIFWTFIHN